MRTLEALDHPFIFLLALTVGVFAMQKIIAYLAGKTGMTELNQWILGK